MNTDSTSTTPIKSQNDTYSTLEEIHHSFIIGKIHNMGGIFHPLNYRIVRLYCNFLLTTSILTFLSTRSKQVTLLLDITILVLPSCPLLELTLCNHHHHHVVLLHCLGLPGLTFLTQTTYCSHLPLRTNILSLNKGNTFLNFLLSLLLLIR